MSLIERSFQEKIVLVGVLSRSQSVDELTADLLELKELVHTAGALVVDTVIQRRDVIDSKTYIGRGKAEELKTICYDLDVDTVVFDNDLTPVQQRNLEHILGRTAIDRTAVILDIFAQNAKSEEGKMQVELALLNYRLPRLRGRGLMLSQQGGGIGTRGPGETQLEVDRRQLLATKTRLERRLKKLMVVADTQRRLRNKNNQYRVSLVGYTNAGKSTLLNSLVNSDEFVADQLFATLDTKIRKLVLKDENLVLISDTVGFIRKLPHHLVEAFKSTLSEIKDSDLLLHVVDGSADDPLRQIEAVDSVLNDLQLNDIPQLLVINKSDLNHENCLVLATKFDNSVVISAKDCLNLESLKDMIYASYLNSVGTAVVAIPDFRADIVIKLNDRILGSFDLKVDVDWVSEFRNELNDKFMALLSMMMKNDYDLRLDDRQSIFELAGELAERTFKSMDSGNYTVAIVPITSQEIAVYRKYILKLI